MNPLDVYLGQLQGVMHTPPPPCSLVFAGAVLAPENGRPRVVVRAALASPEDVGVQLAFFEAALVQLKEMRDSLKFKGGGIVTAHVLPGENGG